MAKALTWIAILWASSAWTHPPAQPQSGVRGTVRGEDGRGIAGVAVYGSKNANGMRERTSTDANGRFQLGNPGAVVHLLKDGFQPALVFVTPDLHTIRVTLKPAVGSLMLPACGKPDRTQRRLGWGVLGLHFDIPSKFEIKRSNPDADYVMYVVQRKGIAGSLQLWLGPVAPSPEPDDRLLLESAALSQRLITTAKGMAGVDSWGRLRNGTYWRHIAVGEYGGAIYTNVLDSDLPLFNAMIDTICLVRASR